MITSELAQISHRNCMLELGMTLLYAWTPTGPVSAITLWAISRLDLRKSVLHVNIPFSKQPLIVKGAEWVPLWTGPAWLPPPPMMPTCTHHTVT